MYPFDSVGGRHRKKILRSPRQDSEGKQQGTVNCMKIESMAASKKKKKKPKMQTMSWRCQHQIGIEV